MSKLVFLVFLIQQSLCELKFVCQLFRHGARSKLYGPFQEQGGELTSVGQRQHFLLGTQLRKEYIDERQFLSQNFNSTEFNVISTNYNRTIQSAQSQLLGFYPLGTGKQISEQLIDLALPEYQKLDINIHDLKNNALPYRYQPIAIHGEFPKEWLRMKMYTKEGIQIYEKNQKTKFYKKFLEEMQQTINQLKKYLGNKWDVNNSDYLNVFTFYDDMISDYYEGIDKPEFIKSNPEFEKQLAFMHGLDFYMLYFFDQESQAFFSESFYDYLNQTIEDSQLNGGHLKWQMLSAHDTNVSLIASTLNITNAECLYDIYHEKGGQHLQCEKPPGYTGNIIMEFYQNSDEKIYLKVRYNGKYVYLCEKQEQECDLQELQQRIYNLLEKNPFKNNKKSFSIFLGQKN